MNTLANSYGTTYCLVAFFQLNLGYHPFKETFLQFNFCPMKDTKDTILYIDDDSINLDLFGFLFDKFFNIITLPSTDDAVNVLKEHPVKVILSDQRMPGENGIDFIKRINPEFPDIIKILVTAFSDYTTAVNAINEASIYRFIQKPWKPEIVLESIKNAITVFDLKKENINLLHQLTEKNQSLEEAYKRTKIAYNKLIDSENKFSTVFSESNDSMYVLNPEYKIVETNNALCNLIGASKSDCKVQEINSFIKENYPILLIKPIELANNKEKSIFDFEMHTIKGELLYIEMNCNTIQLDEKPYILSVLRNITERKLFENKIVEVIIKTQEEVQGKYAKELHDGLGPLLSSLKMNIEALASPNQELNRDKIIDYSVKAIKDAINSVKEIANNLSPHILQRFGLVNAIRSFIEQVKTSVNIDFVVTSNIKEKIPENIELILYRVVLECINNSMKHSKAAKIEISLHLEGNLLNINISDNGIGFEVDNALKDGKGMGIFNIQSRIKNIGGEFRIFSNKTTGTNINIKIKI